MVYLVKPYIPTFMNVKMVFIDLVKTERQYIHDLKSAINVRILISFNGINT